MEPVLTRVRERAAFSLLRGGDVLAALAAVDGAPADERTLRLSVVAAEARSCWGGSDLDEIELLQEQAEVSGDVALALRVEATLAEMHANRASPACQVVAARAVDRVATQPTLPTELLWARARLWRVLALVAVLLEEDRSTRPHMLLMRGQADLHQAGFDAESARWTADFHFARALVFCDDFYEARHAVVECLAALRALRSPYLDLVLAYRVALDLIAGDLASAQAGASEIDGIAAVRPLHPKGRALLGFVRSALQLMGDRPTRTTVDAVEEHLTVVRSESLCEMPSHLVGLASVLADSGYTTTADLRLARRWATKAAEGGVPPMPRIARELSSLLTRLDLLERGDEAAVAAVDADIEQGRGQGLRRDAAQRALRAALAARRVGRHDVARRLHSQAVADLPPPPRRLLWENALDAALSAPVEDGAATATRLRLLGAEVTAQVGTSHRALTTGLARLAVALVAEGGTATADRLVDVLWPGADQDAGRGRLRVALHRLRRALGGSDAVDPVPRRGDLVTLGSLVTVDVVELEKLAAGGVDERRAALDLYETDVARVQLAYDDVAAPLRRRMAAIWRDLARDALADPALSRARVLRIATVAGADAGSDPELAEIHDAAERRLG